uniref:Kinesin family member 25 n=1 Tax=Tetraodon nigroviridis TaxID=99883 RepID=H3D3X2_TETNG
RVHGPDDSQNVVFEEVKPLLTSLLDGYNVCIMAYGQTGSGKTHTMVGSQPQRSLQGIIPKAAAELFRLISEKPAESHTVEVSVMEVHNNEVFDLLVPDDGGLRRDVVTTSSGTSQVTSLTYKPVCNAAEVMQIIGSVLKLRAQCPTRIHANSSRSHLIVTLTISSNSRSDYLSIQPADCSVPKRTCSTPPTGSGGVRAAAAPTLMPATHSAQFRTKLQLVDLAGSECVGMSGVSGAALWEVSCINRSLSALADVLGALAEQRPHVPYRNSKLTHLLQDVIGGDAKLLLMLCVSPTQRFLTESLHSLALGTRARQVQKDLPRQKSATLKETSTNQKPD